MMDFTILTELKLKNTIHAGYSFGNRLNLVLNQFNMIPEQIEANEVVNLIVSAAFLIYYMNITRKGKCSQMPAIWLLGIFLLMVSNVFTVIEGFFFKAFFNGLEHFSFFLATIIFLIGAIRMKAND